jgi:hypothetical protein
MKSILQLDVAYLELSLSLAEGGHFLSQELLSY